MTTTDQRPVTHPTLTHTAYGSPESFEENAGLMLDRLSLTDIHDLPMCYEVTGFVSQTVVEREKDEADDKDEGDSHELVLVRVEDRERDPENPDDYQSFILVHRHSYTDGVTHPWLYVIGSYQGQSYNLCDYEVVYLTPLHQVSSRHLLLTHDQIAKVGLLTDALRHLYEQYLLQLAKSATASAAKAAAPAATVTEQGGSPV